MSTDPKVYIVILNWNGWKDTIECLESVFRNNCSHYQVVVCDNDSSDDSLDKIKRWANGEQEVDIADSNSLKRLSFPCIKKPLPYVVLNRQQAEAGEAVSELLNVPLVLIATGGNLGFAGGNNVGLRYVLRQGDADYVWLLNNDTVIEPDALTNLVAHSKHLHQQQDNPNTCGSMVCFYTDPNVIQALGGSRFNRWSGIASETLGRFKTRQTHVDHHAMANQLDYITGCSWLLPIEFLKQIGLMEERYFLYYEEIDWVTRAQKKFVLTYAPNSIVYHKEGSSIGSKTIRRAPSLLAEHHMARSKVLFMSRYHSFALPIVYLFSLLQALNRMRQGHMQNAWTILKAIAGIRR